MPSVFISGANRGLGLEFARQYLQDGWDVWTSVREPARAESLQELASQFRKLSVLALDVCDAEAIRQVGLNMQQQPIDVLINNAGIFGPKRKAESDLGQTFGHIDSAVCMEVFRVNSVAPLLLAQALLPSIRAGSQRKIVTVSSILGSITYTEGENYAYRMSKAAVNMAMANLAFELKDQGVLVSVISPGWVQTDMGGKDANLTPADSISSVRRVIASLDATNSGVLLDYKGSPVAW